LEHFHLYFGSEGNKQVLEHFFAVHTPLAVVESVADPLVLPDSLVPLPFLLLAIRLLHASLLLKHFIHVKLTLASMLCTLKIIQQINNLAGLLMKETDLCSEFKKLVVAVLHCIEFFSCELKLNR
jgi:hypothetical protein